MNANFLRGGAVAGILLLAAGGTAPARAGEITVITQQWSGATGGAEQPETRTLTTAAEWEAFWQTRHRPAPRSFDGATVLAVVVEIGRRRTGGWRATILSAEPVDGNLVVRYRVEPPPAGAMTMQMITEPWAVAILPRSDLPVIFERAAPAVKKAGDAPPERPKR